MKALIKKVLKGRHKGEFRFVLKADNGEPIATSETYKNRQDILLVLSKYFPTFEVVMKYKDNA